MLFIDICKTYPEIRILHFGKPLPLPVLQPSFIDGIHHIRRIAIYMDLSVFPLYSLKALDHRKKLHTIVGGKRKAFRHLLFSSGTFKHCPIASRAGVSA